MSKLHLDLFSGIGGFAIAAQACGYKTIGFCEREPYAQQILKERFGAVLADAESERKSSESRSSRQGVLCSAGSGGNARLHPDIFTLNGADYAGVDLLTGGFPCQPFSVAGKRRGAEDDRAIWPEMLRVIREAKPTWIIGENVAGIVTMELDNILSDLESVGYSAWPLVVPACAVDARHRRDRVWIVAHATSEQDDGKRGHRERGRDGMERQEQAARRRDGQADHDGTGGQGEDVAHADSGQRDGAQGKIRTGRDSASGGGEDVAHASRELQHGRGQSRDGRGQHPDGGEDVAYGRPEETGAKWLPEPELGRVAHGIPNRAHRLRGLGNAIVPQVAEEIIRAITNLT